MEFSFFGSEAKEIAGKIQAKQDAKKLLSRPANLNQVIKTHDNDADKRRRNPELYSQMDLVAGKVTKNRHAGRKKVLYQGRSEKKKPPTAAPGEPPEKHAAQGKED